MARSLRPVRLAWDRRWDRLSNHLLAFTHCAAAGQTKVLVFVEANAQVTHVISLTAEASRQMVVGLRDALDIADPEGAGGDWSERG